MIKQYKHFIYIHKDLTFPKGLFFPNYSVIESIEIIYVQEFHLIPFEISLISLSNINGEQKKISNFECNRLGYHIINKDINLRIDNEMNIYLLKLQPENLTLKPYIMKENYDKKDFPAFNGLKFLYKMEEK